MILSGSEIIKARAAGDVSIEPFALENVNPNSYNYRLGPHVEKISPAPDGRLLGTRTQLPESGLVLRPGVLYLGATFERIGSSAFVMTLLGRSSMGRLGVFLNVTADLGHVGSLSNWTLEITVVQPVRLFPMMRIGQVAFWDILERDGSYSGRYTGDRKPVACRDADLFRAAPARFDGE